MTERWDGVRGQDNTSTLERFSGDLRFIHGEISRILKDKGIVFVGIAGGSSVGKTSIFANAISRGFEKVTVISGDDYCIGNSRSTAIHGKPNLHVPEDYDVELLSDNLAALRRRSTIEKPVYSFIDRERSGFERIIASDVVIVEGTYALHDSLKDLVDFKLFVSANDHSRFIRRLIRPRRSSSQTDLERLSEYTNLTYPYHYSHLLPTRANADLIIENDYIAIQEVTKILNIQLHQLSEEGVDQESFRARFPQSFTNTFSRKYFSHKSFAPGELLYVEENSAGTNKLFYGMEGAENGTSPLETTCIVFDTETETVPLEKIGYRRVCVVGGKEIILQDGKAFIKLIQLENGASVIQRSYLFNKNNVTIPSVTFRIPSEKLLPISLADWEIAQTGSR